MRPKNFGRPRSCRGLAPLMAVILVPIALKCFFLDQVTSQWDRVPCLNSGAPGVHVVAAAKDLDLPGSEHSSLLESVRRKWRHGLVVDVGSSEGGVAALAAAFGFRVLAFEALWENVVKARVLVDRVGLSQSVTVVHSAVGNETGTLLSFDVTTDAATGWQNALQAPASNTFTARSLRLDDVLSEDAVLLKIDVMGYEGLTLQGAHNWLERFHVPVVHIVFAPARIVGMDPVMMLQDVASKGYSVYLEACRNGIVPEAVQALPARCSDGDLLRRLVAGSTGTEHLVAPAHFDSMVATLRAFEQPNYCCAVGLLLVRSGAFMNSTAGNSTG